MRIKINIYQIIGLPAFSIAAYLLYMYIKQQGIY